VQRTGRPFEVVVNDALRTGLDERTRGTVEPFRVEARPLGLRKGVRLDDISELLDQVDGADER